MERKVILMFVSKVQRETIGLITNLYQYYTGQLSSVLALVGFKLQIDNVQLTPVGGFNGRSIQAFSLSDLHEGEITYERVASFLISSEINLLATFSADTVELPNGVTGYRKTITIDNDVEDNGDEEEIVIRPSAEMTSKGISLDCCGKYKFATFELLFVARNETKKLPPEFNSFRVWKNWLTLGNSFAEIAKVSFLADDDLGKYEVYVEPRFDGLEEIIKQDLYRLSLGINPEVIHTS